MATRAPKASEVYFPNGAPEHLWAGASASTAETWQRMLAPLGKPAIFLREGTTSAVEIVAALEAEGVY
jgi:sulfoquinovosidase